MGTAFEAPALVARLELFLAVQPRSLLSWFTTLRYRWSNPDLLPQLWSITRSYCPLNGKESDYILRQCHIPEKGSFQASSCGIKVNLKINPSLF